MSVQVVVDSTKGVAQTTAKTWWKCTSQRLAFVVGTVLQVCGSMKRLKPRCVGYIAQATWQLYHTTTCLVHLPMVGLQGENAAQYVTTVGESSLEQAEIDAEKARLFAPLDRPEGLSAEQVEYKLRRMVNDYLQPPKTRQKMEIGLRRFEEIKHDIAQISATHPHELMRAAEVSVIRDCAEMAARASLFRTESRWGLYHHRADHPQKNDQDWFCHAHLKKDAFGQMVSFKKSVEPYIIPIEQQERQSYEQLRIQKHGDEADVAQSATQSSEQNSTPNSKPNSQPSSAQHLALSD